jgi:hypothetical protein
VPQPLDNELLAWAAGFFDGEGSTIAKSDARRPDYYQLDVSVPQAGPHGIPEVLLKFQRAMLGVGAIDLQPDGLMYKWRAGGGLTAEMSLALMWPWLGEVKRAQALRALEIVVNQFEHSARRPRSPRYHPEFVAHGEIPLTDTTRLARAWAAGFVDAEGYFGLPKANQRRDGTLGYVIRASVTQHGQVGVPPEVLLRLRHVLGVGRIERHGEPDDFKLVVEGTKHVRGVLESLRPWLGSVKTQQATVALEKHDASRVRGTSDRCKRGHVYDQISVRADGTIHRRCSVCARMAQRLSRLAQGIKPRRFRHPENRLEEPAIAYAA